jgi:hypothetical protein
MFTVYASPTHVLPQGIAMPTLVDDLGGGAQSFRRRFTRPLSRWTFEVPGIQSVLDPQEGFFKYTQSDTPFWFDGAGAEEVSVPVILGVGDGVKTDFILNDCHVFVNSLVVYANGGLITSWDALGGDGITCQTIRFTAAPAVNVQITAKYRRKYKVVLVSDTLEKQRSHRNQSTPEGSVYRLSYNLQEVAV